MDIDAALAEAQADILRRVRLATDTLGRHVTPVLTYRKSGNFEFEGSALLAKLQQRYYLVTAAHVLDACEHGVFLPMLSGAGEPLSGDLIVTGRPKGKTRSQDRFDIGFVRLSPPEVQEIGLTRFLDLTYTIDSPPAEPVLLTIVLGFPVREQEVNERVGTLETALSMFMTGAADDKGYQLAKIDHRSHVLLRYHREAILYNGKTRGAPPSFKGISGGGVWPVSLRDDHTSDNPPPLAAMVIERPAAFGHALLATRAHVVRRFIQQFDDVP